MFSAPRKSNQFFPVKSGDFEKSTCVENSVETVENKRFFHLCPRMWKLVESFAGRLSQTPAVRGITGASVRNGAAGMPFVPNRETGP